MKYDRVKLTPAKRRETCAVLGSRFRILLSDAGLSPDQAAKLLHVTPRTIRYWISGRVMVPYAAYRLVRVMRLFELPCEGWDGWHMHSGKLWSPEGFGFTPHDSNWWSLLVRRASLFGQMYERDRQVDIALQRLSNANQTGGTPLAGGSRAASRSASAISVEPLDLHTSSGLTPKVAVLVTRHFSLIFGILPYSEMVDSLFAVDSDSIVGKGVLT